MDGIELGRDEVHLWWSRVGDLDPAGDWRGWLSDEERGRCERFHREEDARAFAEARAILRGTLACYVAQAPGELVFETGLHGKPRLVAHEPRGVCFNLSHSGDWILLAISCKREVGVDIEQMSQVEDLSLLAERVLSLEERAEFEGLARPDQPRAFFRLWARKEAALKALGLGLIRDPRGLTVGLEEANPGTFVRPRGGPTWEGIALRDLEAPPGFAAAVAAEGEDWRPVLAVAVAGEACAPA